MSQKFDGYSVDLYAGKFAGTFDVDAADAADQKLDGDVFFVVRAKVREAGIKPNKNGDYQRVNTYGVVETVKIPDDVGFKLQTALSAQMALSFSDGGLLDDNDWNGDE